MTSNITFTIKWSGAEYAIEVTAPDATVADLKRLIQDKTGVRPDRQKLLGLKAGARPATDESRVSDLNIKSGGKIMMMGSREEDIAVVSKEPEDLPEVINDLDIPEGVELPVAHREEYLAKIDKRVREVKINILNEPRPGKKLLVLDIDYTLFDHRSVAEHPHQLMRPHLHEFLTSAYEDYDIVIWSATSMKWIEVKMRQLGVTTNPNYRITFMLDSLAMISVHTQEYGYLDVKPLGVIWGKFPDVYTSKNTIMFDDIRRNFLMNPQNGLRIKAFREAAKNMHKDRELLRLSRYLKIIAGYDDFSQLNHRHWKTFIKDDDDD